MKVLLIHENESWKDKINSKQAMIIFIQNKTKFKRFEVAYLEFSSEYLITNNDQGFLCVDVNKREFTRFNVGKILLKSPCYRHMNFNKHFQKHFEY